ncbi:DUF4232 domain-containing protein [Streptomyces aidingensis]|uniref:DUF4232 domain-containing protein n=1 Tax=Streptomyces aidingensis TaxID=910347 RepID=A0A1I1SM86_9ACTN|nr:DUF4232 domain-containing protein [Streptomyces aidingensis]SFD47589.1 Protein of unknown function [Streptomyces aidingensis]
MTISAAGPARSARPPGRAARRAGLLLGGLAVLGLAATGCGDRAAVPGGGGETAPVHPVTPDTLDPEDFERDGSGRDELPDVSPSLPLRPDGSAASASPPPPCPEPGVRIAPGAVEAAMGLRVMGLVLTNCGPDDYRIEGYPAVSLLDGSGRPMDGIEVVPGSAGIAVVEGFDDPPRPVALAPGERATAALMWRNTVTAADRPAASARWVEVTPAPGEDGRRVSPDGGIDLGTTAVVGVGPWRAHPG